MTSPSELRKRILQGDDLEDGELLMLLWGTGSGSGAAVNASRVSGLLEDSGGLKAWVDNAWPETLRPKGVWGARAARLLAAAEIARRTRDSSESRNSEGLALSALELIAVTLESIADDPSPREVTMCAELIRAIQRTATALGSQPMALDSRYHKLIQELRRAGMADDEEPEDD